MNMEELIWERDKRLIQQNGFAAFCLAFGYKPAKHHQLLIKKLERAIHEPGYNLVISMPPGHAKSTYSSVLFPAYILGNFAKKSVLMLTHTQDFSDRWGRFCRRIISTPKYQYIFNSNLSRDSQASSRFDLSNGSEYFGSGILGNITGHRGDILLMDDLLRGKEDADSETMRDKVWNAYVYDVRTRIKPGASKIMIATRWHEDDPIGRILVSNERNDWDVINLCALTENKTDVENDALGRDVGEALWPEYISKEMLVKERDSLNKEDMRMWSSLYQGRPTIEDGDYFRKEWIQIINKLPEGLQYYGASDYAVTDGRGDYTVHLICGYDDKNDDIYIVDVWREQTTTEIWVEKFLYMAKKYKTLIWAEESGQIIKSLDPFIIKEMNNRSQFVFREQFTCATNKTVRARSFQAYMAQKKVFIINKDWTNDFTKELLSFPAGKHDDMVDASGLIGRLLTEMVMRVEKKRKLEEYEYKSGAVMLPGLDARIGTTNKNVYKRI